MKNLFIRYDDYDALGLAQLVRSRQVTPDELLDTALAVAEQVDPTIRALCHLSEPAARAAIAAGLPEGPFTGVPFLLKDITAVATDIPSSLGSLFFANQQQTYDSETVRRLRATGLVFFGRTTTPELAFNVSTEAAVYGAPTRNAWDPRLSAGGSSGGAGAAVAAGIVPMAHGSDGGGSIRTPAAVNGIFGLKPTRARLPAGPYSGEGWGGLLCENVLSRSVRDCAAAMDATHGTDVGAPYVAPPPPMRYAEAIAAPPRRLRIALMAKRFDGNAVEPEIAQATREAARLCEQLGHQVEEAAPLFDYWAMQRAFVTVVCCGTAMAITERIKTLGRAPHEDELEPTTWSVYETGLKTSGPDYLAALSTLHRLSREVGRFFEQYDVLITPMLTRLTAPIGEFAMNQRDVIEFRLGEHGVANYVAFTGVSNMTGQPAMTVPLAWSRDAGIPIGTQFIGRFGEEHDLLALAAQLEAAQPWFHRRPSLVPTAQQLADLGARLG